MLFVISMGATFTSLDVTQRQNLLNMRRMHKEQRKNYKTVIIRKLHSSMNN